MREIRVGLGEEKKKGIRDRDSLPPSTSPLLVKIVVRSLATRQKSGVASSGGTAWIRARVTLLPVQSSVAARARLAGKEHPTMASYSEDQLAEFQEAFQLFDSRGDGKIHVSQIGDALRALGQNPTESDVKKFTHQHKPDERISFEVFLPIYQAISKSRTSDTADDFIEGLRHFDKDGNGFISSAELRHLLTTLGEKLSDEEVETLLAGHEDSQGNINYEDFVRQVMCG